MPRREQAPVGLALCPRRTPGLPQRPRGEGTWARIPAQPAGRRGRGGRSSPGARFLEPGGLCARACAPPDGTCRWLQTLATRPPGNAGLVPALPRRIPAAAPQPAPCAPLPARPPHSCPGGSPAAPSLQGFIASHPLPCPTSSEPQHALPLARVRRGPGLTLETQTRRPSAQARPRPGLHGAFSG